MVDTIPTVDQRKLNDFGTRHFAKFEDYVKDRKSLEDQWLKSMRQFRGIIDPEILKHLAEDQSRAYPKVTRTKVINTVARLMEMLFPSTQKNWGVTPGTLPDIQEAELQKILTELETEKTELGEEVTDTQIETAIMEFAKVRADRMELEVQDQLEDIDYTRLIRRIVFSGVLYSAGVLKGPLIKQANSRTWAKDANGKWKAKSVEKQQPYFEVTPLWNHYPDLSAKTLDQKDGDFERHIMSRKQVTALSKRADFMGDQITTWLNNHPVGNFREQHWETELRSTGDKKNITNLSGRKYEIIEWWGGIAAEDLRASGVKLPEGDKSDMFDANIWMLGNTVIKSVLNPFDRKFSPYHIFIYEEDDISLLGSGLPAVVRDSQLSVCEASRMLLDNSSVTSGPMLEINLDMLVPDQDLSIHAYKAFLREGDINPNSPAVRQINVDSHISDLKAVVELFMGFADMETALPPPATGDLSQGGSEALRTSTGASMLLGAASLPIRDTVRNFDVFTESVIGSLVEWNMVFNPKQNIKGDFTTVSHGSGSLVAKEVRANSLNLFRQTLSEEEQIYIDTKKMLIERMEANDVPKDILASEEDVKVRQDAQAEALAKATEQQDKEIEASVNKIMSEVVKNISLAHKADTAGSNDALEIILKGFESAISASQPKTQARSGSSSGSK